MLVAIGETAFRGECRAVRRCALAMWLLVVAFAIPNIASAQWLAGLTSQSPAAPVTPPSPPHPSVCRVVVKERGSISYGSGTLIDVRENVGLVITNWHVVVDADGPITVIFPNGFQSPARVLMTDKDWDLAALAIWKPDIPPVTISNLAPVIGEPLAIAGYGSGDWRMAVGKCNQYVAPAENLPYEMVEVSAEARQGDSGGPILNARGELAGVLFGASRGTTSGSYAGRVRMFLKPILESSAPASTPAENFASTPVSQPQESRSTVMEPVGPVNSPVYDSAPPAQVSAKVPSAQPGWDDPLPGESNSRAVPLADRERPVPAESTAEQPAAAEMKSAAVNAADSPRMASIAPNMSPVERIDAADAGLVHTPLPPRGGATAATTPTSMPFAGLPPITSGQSEPWQQLWQQIAGTSPFDQGKTVLAALGILTVLYRFLGRERAEEGEE